MRRVPCRVSLAAYCCASNETLLPCAARCVLHLLTSGRSTRVACETVLLNLLCFAVLIVRVCVVLCVAVCCCGLQLPTSPFLLEVVERLCTAGAAREKRSARAGDDERDRRKEGFRSMGK